LVQQFWGDDEKYNLFGMFKDYSRVIKWVPWDWKAQTGLKLFLEHVARPIQNLAIDIRHTHYTVIVLLTKITKNIQYLIGFLIRQFQSHVLINLDFYVLMLTYFFSLNPRLFSTSN